MIWVKPVAHDAFFRAGFAVWRRAACRAGFPPVNLGRTASWELSLKAASTVCVPFPARAPSRAPNMRNPQPNQHEKNASCATGFTDLASVSIDQLWFEWSRCVRNPWVEGCGLLSDGRPWTIIWLEVSYRRIAWVWELNLNYPILTLPNNIK